MRGGLWRGGKLVVVTGRCLVRRDWPLLLAVGGVRGRRRLLPLRLVLAALPLFPVIGLPFSVALSHSPPASLPPPLPPPPSISVPLSLTRLRSQSLSQAVRKQ